MPGCRPSGSVRCRDRPTRLRGRLDHPGAQTLAGHFHQAKARNATHLNAGAVSLELVLHPLFNGSIVLALVHVDEVDDDQTCKVTQTQADAPLRRRLQGWSLAPSLRSTLLWSQRPEFTSMATSASVTPITI